MIAVVWRELEGKKFCENYNWIFVQTVLFGGFKTEHKC